MDTDSIRYQYGANYASLDDIQGATNNAQAMREEVSQVFAAPAGRLRGRGRGDAAPEADSDPGADGRDPQRDHPDPDRGQSVSGRRRGARRPLSPAASRTVVLVGGLGCRLHRDRARLRVAFSSGQKERGST